jgi:iron complex outermembrane receptor protein
MSKLQGASGASVHRVRVAVRFAMGLGLLGATVPPIVLAATGAGADALDEIVVTAQFRTQNLQSTPLSITAVNAELLESRNQTNIAEVASQAPNVTLKPQGAAFGPSMGASIRGVGQFDFNPALEPGVGLYVDDVYFATLTGSVLDLLDLDRVEILRGPQGTLAGKNSIGGAVKLYSKKPTGSNSGYLSATYGSNSRLDLRGSADFAISDSLFAHVSGVSKRQGGYISRLDYGCKFPSSGVPILAPVSGNCVVGTLGDVNYDAVRAALRWVATDNLEISGAVDYTNDDRPPAGAVLVQGSTTVNPNIQPVQGVGGTALPISAFVPPAGSYYNYASFYNPKGTFTRLAPPAGATTPMLETRPDIRAKFKGWGASGNIDWKLSNSLSLKSITAYREYDSYFANDNDLSPLANSLGFGTLTFHSFSEEARLNGAAFANDSLEYTLGAFYMNQKSIYATTQDLRYSAASLTQFIGNDPVNADTTAYFGHLSYKATDKLTLTAGLRYTDEHKDYTFSRRTYAGALHPTLGVLDGVKKDYDGSKVDYRANVQYQWTDTVMTYLQYATGFKGGGVSPRPFSPAQAVPFNPEELKSYEAGVKSDLFDRKLRVNASAFFSKYSDLQLTLSNCPQFPPASPCAVVANAGNAEMKGVELETVLRPVDGLSIDGSISYLDFKYTYLNPQAGGPSRPAGPQFGMRPAYVPKLKWSLGVQYEIGMGDRGSLSPRIDVSHQGELFSNGFNAATNRIDAYTVANARLTWKDTKNEWEGAVEVTNLTDKYYFITRFDQFTTTGVTDGQPGRPREFAVTVKKKF